MRSGDDVANNRIQVAQDVARRHPQNLHAATSEECFTPCITLGTITAIMGLAIDFNHQPTGRAVKIGHEPAERMLLPKLEPVRPRPQRLPQQNFRQRHLLAQSSGDRERRWQMRSHQAHTGSRNNLRHRETAPSVALRAPPPPAGEE